MGYFNIKLASILSQAVASFCEAGELPEIWKGRGRREMARHRRGDFDNFENSRFSWPGERRAKTVANRAHIRLPTKRAGVESFPTPF